MATILAGRFNFGFVLFSLVILSPVSADVDGTTTAEVPPDDLSKEIKSTENLPFNSISETLQTDNSVDGGLRITTNADFAADAKTEIDELTPANGNYEGSLNVTVEPKSITTPTHIYNSVTISATTVVGVEDDPTTTTNSGVDALWTAKANNDFSQVQNNSIQHQENISLQFVGNSLDDINNNSTENKTENTKPTKETIMGVGVKTTVSVSLRVEDAKITGVNLINAERVPRNSSCQSFFANNGVETTNSVLRNSTCYEATDNVTDANNETAQIIQKSSVGESAPKSAPETDQQNSTEINANATGINGTEANSHQPNNNNNTGIYFNGTEISSSATNITTETDSNVTYHNSTENDSVQLNTTDIINITQNSTETTAFEEVVSNSTETSTTVRRIMNTSSPVNASNENYTDTMIPNSNTSEHITTRIMTPPPTTTGASWPTTDAETENATATDIIMTTPEPLIKFAGVMKVVQGLNWSSKLHNRHNPEYKKVAKIIQSLLKDVFNSTTLAGILKDVEIDGFSQGSVVVDYFLILVKSDALDPEYLIHAFNSYFKNNSTYSGLMIDPKATEFEVVKVQAVKPTTEPRVEPPVPQWVVAVVVISAASLVFIILFAAVTIYGRHYGRRSYNKKLQGNEIIFDKPDYQSGPRLSDAAYENLAADAVYDVENSPEKTDGMINSSDNQFDSWRTNRLTRMPSTKRFSFNSS